MRRLRAQIGHAADARKDFVWRKREAGNAAELFAQPDIDGGLIGGASLVAADFVAICAAVPK